MLLGILEFLSTKFAACWKPPSQDNHRKASYPRTQQRDHVCVPDHAIRADVKMTRIIHWPRCQYKVIQLTALFSNINFFKSLQGFLNVPFRLIDETL